MHFAFLPGLPLQIPLSEQVIEQLTRVQEAPILLRIITVCVGLGIVLTFLEKQFKLLDSLIGTLQSIRTKLRGEAETTVPNTQADRAKLLKASKIKTDKRLADVLSTDQLIALSWDDRPQEVGRVQRAMPVPESVPDSAPNFMTRLQSLSPIRLFKLPQQQEIALPPSESLMDVFKQGDVAGRLLILGTPGSGKTTTLLELARELITKAEEHSEAPVPIIFELSNWTKDQQPIEQWLVAQLKEEYNVPLKTGQHWIATHQILPLLDGLDELGLVRQQKCAVKINEFLPVGEPDRQAVVCCRTKEFRLGEIKLTGLNGAVELQPLSDGQIQGYLTAMSQPSLWAQTIRPSVELTELAQTPLMLTVMAVALANRPAQTQAELFEAYLEERFTRYENERGILPYSRRDACQYLEILAAQLKIKNQTAFLIETMQPKSWLKTRIQRLAYGLIITLPANIFIWLLLGWGFWLQIRIRRFLNEAMSIGLVETQALETWPLVLVSIIGLMFGLMLIVFGTTLWRANIEPFERFKLPFVRKIRKISFRKMLFRISTMSMLGFVFWLLKPSPIEILVCGISLFLGALIPSLRSEIEIRTQPNQGIFASAKNSLGLAMIVGVLIAVLLYVSLKKLPPPVWVDSDQIPGIFVGIILGSVLSAISLNGGFACVQHLALRIVLWRSGAIPWNYAKFLKYTSELRLTRQTGGEFRFFHDLLREHLAQSSP